MPTRYSIRWHPRRSKYYGSVDVDLKWNSRRAGATEALLRLKLEQRGARAAEEWNRILRHGMKWAS